MIRIVVMIVMMLTASAASAADLVNFASPEGLKRLEHSDAKVDFAPLANHFESQENKLFCGLASSTIILNTLRLDNQRMTTPQDTALVSAPEREYLPKGFDPVFTRYTQHNVLGSTTKSRMEVLGKPIAIKGKKISDYGLQLQQLATVLKANGLQVQVRVANDALNEGIIRKELIANMKTVGDYVLVNYSRKSLNQGDGGHISPLGAYDAHSDSFLILDVNPNTAGWAWVKTPDLIAAMRTFDTVENRGYVLVQEGRL